MQQRKLGNADFTISPVGLGTWAIAGAGWEFGWGRRMTKKACPRWNMPWNAA